MITYLIEVSIGWALFYALYFLVLRQMTHFALNRWYLLGSFVTAMLLPLFPPLWVIARPEPAVIPEAVNIDQYLALLQYLDEAPVVETAETTKRPINWWMIAYWTGAGLMAFRLLLGMIKIALYYVGGKRISKGFYQLVLTQKSHLPFSFFRWIFWSRSVELEGPDSERMLKHEEAHIREGHTLDVLLVELVGVLAWCSPLLYLYRKALRSNHEYLADAAVIKEYRLKEYGHLLIKQSLSGPKVALANHLIHSQLKKRIVMMTKKRSSRLSLLRYLLVAPLTALLLMAFAKDTDYALDEIQLIPEHFSSLSLDEQQEAPASFNEAALESPAIEEKKKKELYYKFNFKYHFNFDIAEDLVPMNEVSKGFEKALLQLGQTVEPGDTTKPDPLIVINQEEKISSAQLQTISPQLIKSINVLKGQAALDKYGEEGKNGVIEINCPDCAQPFFKRKDGLPKDDRLYILNGKEVPQSVVVTIPQKKIKQIDVRDEEYAIAKYGEKGKNGVVELICPTCEEDSIVEIPAQEEEIVEVPAEEAPGGLLGEGTPLFIVNGVEVSKEAADEIAAEGVKEITIWKGDKAVEKYGERGKNGVIELDCPSCDPEELKEEKELELKIRPQPLFILNSTKVAENVLKKIEPQNIKSITVLKDPKATEKYGEEGKNGVVIINCPKCDVDKLAKESNTFTFKADQLQVQEQKDNAFRLVDQMPLFKGSDKKGLTPEAQKALSDKRIVEYVQNYMQPVMENTKEDIHKTGVVEFIINKSGETERPVIRRSLGKEVDKEVIEMVEKMPRFIPGTKDGKKVDVKFTLPVRFKSREQQQLAQPKMEAEVAKKAALEKQLSSNSLQLQQFNATPNPTRGRLHLQFQAAPGNTLLRILDASGREVINEQLPNFNGLYDEYLDLSKAPKGMLLISISQGEKVFNSKIILQ